MLPKAKTSMIASLIQSQNERKSAKSGINLLENYMKGVGFLIELKSLK